MKKINNLIFCFLCFTSCINSVMSDTTKSKTIPYGYLEEAFNSGNVKMLHEFLQDWQDRYSPISGPEWSDLKPAAQAAYQVYQQFFMPVPSSDSQIYFIVQKELNVVVRDNFEKITVRNQEKWLINSKQPPLSEFQLTDIRPRPSESSRRILYLNDDYEELVFEFLDTLPGPELRKMSLQGARFEPQYSIEERKKRFQFLKQALFINRGHWGDVLLTLPRIFEINFNRKLDEAVVKYGLRGSGGNKQFQKINGVWEKRGNFHTWIN